MPYVGKSPLDGTAETFMQGMSIGTSRRELKRREAQDAQYAKFAEAAQKLNEQEEVRRQAQELRYKADSEAAAKSRSLVDQAAQTKLDEAARERAQQLGMVPAELQAQERMSRQLIKQFPEMEGDIKAHWGIAGNIKDPETRAEWLKMNTPGLMQKANTLAVQKTAQKAMADAKEGHFAPGGQPDEELDAEYQGIVEALSMGQITPQKAQEGLRSIKVKAAKLNGKRMRIQSGREALTQEFVGKFPPGSDELESATAVIDMYGAEELTMMQARETLTKLSQPKDETENPRMKGMLQILKEIPTEDENGDPVPIERRLDMAEKIHARLSGEPQSQPAPDPEMQKAQKFRDENPNATEAEFRAFMKGEEKPEKPAAEPAAEKPKKPLGKPYEGPMKEDSGMEVGVPYTKTDVEKKGLKKKADDEAKAQRGAKEAAEFFKQRDDVPEAAKKAFAEWMKRQQAKGK